MKMPNSSETQKDDTGLRMLFLFDICNSTEIASRSSGIENEIFYAKISLVTNKVIEFLNKQYEHKISILQYTGDGFYLCSDEPLHCIALWRQLNIAFQNQHMEIRCGASYGRFSGNSPQIGNIANVVSRCCSFPKEGGALCVTSLLYDLTKNDIPSLSPDITITPIANPQLKGLKEEVIYLFATNQNEKANINSFHKNNSDDGPERQDREDVFVKWLHLSDMQFGAGRYNEIMYASLLEDIEKVTPKLDFIFVTGDIAFSGAQEQYDKAMGFFEKLLEITNVPKERLFIVPGNHDVQRGDIHDTLFIDNCDDSERNNCGGNDRYLELMKLISQKGLYNYHVFKESLLNFTSQNNNYRKPYYCYDVKLEKTNISVVGFNTALLSSRTPNNDIRKLGLDERTVIEAYSKANNDITITLLHHPLLQYQTRKTETVTRIINNRSTFVLHGHIKDHNLILDNNGGPLPHYVSAGVMYENGDRAVYYNYTSINISKGKCETVLRKFYRGEMMWESYNPYPDHNNGSISYSLKEDWVKNTIAVNQKNSTIEVQPQTSIGFQLPQKETIRIPRIPKYLLKDIIAGECVLFAGAGASSDGGLPTMSEFVYALIDFLESSGEEKLDRETKDELMHLFDCHNYDPILHYCIDKLGSTDFSRILREKLDCRGSESLVHETISKIPFKKIITVNFDQFIEKYCLKIGRQYTVILPDDMDKGVMETGSSLPIYKIRGTLEKPSSIRITSHDIGIQFLKNDSYKATLLEILKEYTVLFFGTSLSDIDICLLLAEVFEKNRYSGKKHYALLPHVKKVEKEYFLSKYNLQVISYDSSYNHVAALQFLENLSNRAKLSAFRNGVKEGGG